FLCSALRSTSHRAHRALHSFPTRRSSDLEERIRMVEPGTAAARCRLFLIVLSGALVLAGCGGEEDETQAQVGDGAGNTPPALSRSEEHTSELQSRENLVCRLLLEKKKKNK